MNPIAAKLLGRLLIYPALLCAAISFVCFWIYAHPKRYLSSRKPAHLKLPSETVTLRTADGLALDAWFIPNPKASHSVIVCHGYPMDKGDVLDMAAFLAGDFNLLYFDFRALGRSGGFFSTGGQKETRDIDAAVDFLRDRLPGGRIGIFGFSMGAAAALLAQNPALQARAADSAFADLAPQMRHIFSGFGFLSRPLVFLMRGWSLLLTGVDLGSVSPRLAAARHKTPILLIHGEADTVVPPANAQSLKDAAPAAELYLVRHAGHGGARDEAGKEYEQRLTAFFRKALN